MPITAYRTYEGATRAIFAFGAPAFLAGEAVVTLAKKGLPTDVHIVNGLPLRPEVLENLLTPYSDGVVTVEDGFIGTQQTGVRGFAGLMASAANSAGLPRAHIGITDPRIAPSDGHLETWEHFGITAKALVDAVHNL